MIMSCVHNIMFFMLCTHNKQVAQPTAIVLAISAPSHAWKYIGLEHSSLPESPAVEPDPSCYVHNTCLHHRTVFIRDMRLSLSVFWALLTLATISVTWGFGLCPFRVRLVTTTVSSYSPPQSQRPLILSLPVKTKFIPSVPRLESSGGYISKSTVTLVSVFLRPPIACCIRFVSTSYMEQTKVDTCAGR